MAATIRQLAKARAPLAAASRLSTRAASTYTLPDLDYDYGALEPYISGEIMQLHHAKHHATYVNNFNASLEKLQPAEAAGDASGIVNLQAALKFNGGGAFSAALVELLSGFERLSSYMSCFRISCSFKNRSYQPQHLLEELVSAFRKWPPRKLTICYYWMRAFIVVPVTFMHCA